MLFWIIKLNKNMKNIKMAKVVIIVIGVMLLLFGCAIGIMLEKQKILPQVTTSVLSSKLITSVTATGKIAQIDGRKITLNSLGDSLIILLADSAHIYTLVSTNTGKISGKVLTQKSSIFGDIKVGDNVIVSLKLLANNQIEGISVTIFPVSVVTK